MIRTFWQWAILAGVPLGFAIDALIAATLWNRREVIHMALAKQTRIAGHLFPLRAAVAAALIGATVALVATSVLIRSFELTMSL